jgi:TRAP transporter TAXI family solute receptor
MKKLLLFVFVVVLSVALIACSNQQGAQSNEGTKQADEPVRLAIGSTSAGSSYYAYTTGIANAINMSPKIQAVVEEIGSTGELVSQVPLRPQTYIALGVSDVAYKFYAGDEPFTKPYDSLRTWLPGPASYCQHFVTVESGITSFYELPGHRYGTGQPSSSTEITTKEIFALLGIEGVEYVTVPNADAADAVKNRQIVGLASGSPPPAAMIMDMATALDLRMLAFTEEELNLILDTWPYYTTTVVPKGAYDFVTEDTVVPGVPANFYIDKTFDEDLAYEMTKTLWENIDLVKEAHNFGEKLIIEDIADVAVPIHPGALKYYLEQGIEIPDRLYPPEFKK